MKINKAEVVIMSGHNDLICLVTDLPSPYKNGEENNEPLVINFNCFRNHGAEYVRKHFDIEPTIISVS